MSKIVKSNKLASVSYDIRGAVHKEARRLELEGTEVLKLNIGNPGAFGFDAPAQLVEKMDLNLQNAKAYSDSKGILEARESIRDYHLSKGIKNITTDDIFIGNGVSELIVMCMQALVNSGDEILIPAPDYPLWTASVNLAGGTPVHYVCDEESDWNPDISDMEKKINSNTKAIVLINPNNPTGALYSKDILKKIVKLAQENDLIIFADEIYDKILYDGAEHTSPASLADDILFITFNGLSKSYLACGYRSGWMVVSGNKEDASDFIDGLEVLSSMRLCSNVTSMYAIKEALEGYQNINDLTSPGGRLYEQRNAAYESFNAIDGISCTKPQGALYIFPKIDIKKFNITSDSTFVLDLLKAEKILLVHGTGFNWMNPDHFRVVTLPAVSDIKRAAEGIGRFLQTYQQ